MRYCDSPYLFRRRVSREITIGDPARGGVLMGAHHPVVKQSMLTCDTMDTAESVKQTLELVAVEDLARGVELSDVHLENAGRLRFALTRCP